MTKIVLTSRVDKDGVLRLAVPLEPRDADREVQITIESETPAQMTPSEWSAWVDSIAGSIQDPSFRRHEQGEYEVREQFP